MYFLKLDQIRGGLWELLPPTPSLMGLLLLTSIITYITRTLQWQTYENGVLELCRMIACPGVATHRTIWEHIRTM